MNLSGDLRNDLEAISSILQSLNDMHQSGVDRTSNGCQSMARMAVILEDYLNDLASTIHIIEKK